MIDNPVIVGCGTVGASLSIKLSQQKIISNLKLYDFDIVSELTSYPFKQEESGLLKAEIILFLCKKYNPNLSIESYQEKVIKPLSFNSFVIDCRDNKSSNINAKVRISLDGYLLYIDSIYNRKNNQNYHRYLMPRNEVYINKAVDIISDYLVTSKYIFRELKLYNLEDNTNYILKKEEEECL